MVILRVLTNAHYYLMSDLLCQCGLNGTIEYDVGYLIDVNHISVFM